MKQGLVFFLICGLAILAGCATPITEKGGGHNVQKHILRLAHAFLVRDQAEEKGYGLYSYLLFGSPPNDANRDLYIQAISACVKGMPNINHFEEVGFHRHALNVTYIPISKAIPTNKDELKPEWILENYDYARAYHIFENLPGAYTDGPYFISTFNPLGNRHQTLSEGEGYLHQDLSRVPPTRPDLIDEWITEFLEQVSWPGHKDECTMEEIVLEIRVYISIAAESLPDIISVLESLIAWAK